MSCLIIILFSRNILPKPGHPISHQSSSLSILNMITSSKAAINTLSVPKAATVDSNQHLQYQIHHQTFMNALMMNDGVVVNSAAALNQNTSTCRQDPIGTDLVYNDAGRELSRDFSDLYSFLKRIEDNVRPPSVNGSLHINSNATLVPGFLTLLIDLTNYAKRNQLAAASTSERR